MIDESPEERQKRYRAHAINATALGDKQQRELATLFDGHEKRQKSIDFADKLRQFIINLPE